MMTDTAELERLDDILRDPLNGLTWENRIMAADSVTEVIALRAEVDRLAEFVAEFDDGDGSDGCMCRSCRANALIAAHTQRVNEKEGQG